MARPKEMTFGEILKKEAILENRRAAKYKKREVTYQRKKEASHIDFIDQCVNIKQQSSMNISYLKLDLCHF